MRTVEELLADTTPLANCRVCGVRWEEERWASISWWPDRGTHFTVTVCWPCFTALMGPALEIPE